MGQVIVLKHVRLTRAFQVIESAALSLDSELRGLRAIAGTGLADFPEEVAMLRTYVRTLSVLLQSMAPDEIAEAGLEDRHAVAETAVRHCAAALKTIDAPQALAAISDIA
ncbi:class 3 adenylate cyclase [Azospirillum agricola]|uniref:hypothetical protein n=1 Tax=Azospirillum agricola TaxID=1720247 RepID=UPI001AE81D8B|nr:hypothetical protein [Azospirillum agricola]MBP2228100.1 class 3 adenylate cyclase [Azospirillum agricola]